MSRALAVALALGGCGGEVGPLDAGGRPADASSADAADALDVDAAGDDAPGGQVCATAAGDFVCSPDEAWTWTNVPVDDGGSCLDAHCPVGSTCDLGGVRGVCE